MAHRCMVESLFKIIDNPVKPHFTVTCSDFQKVKIEINKTLINNIKPQFNVSFPDFQKGMFKVRFYSTKQLVFS